MATRMMRTKRTLCVFLVALAGLPLLATSQAVNAEEGKKSATESFRTAKTETETETATVVNRHGDVMPVPIPSRRFDSDSDIFDGSNGNAEADLSSENQPTGQYDFLHSLHKHGHGQKDQDAAGYDKSSGDPRVRVSAKHGVPSKLYNRRKEGKKEEKDEYKDTDRTNNDKNKNEDESSRLFFAETRTDLFPRDLQFANQTDVCRDDNVPIPTDGTLIIGSTDMSALSDACSLYFRPAVQAQWFTVIGNGKDLLATTCTEATGFDTRMALFEGSSCDSLTCLDENDDSSDTCSISSVTSTVIWFAEMGQIYHLQVYGFGTSTGTFGLTVSPLEDVSPLNDRCLDVDDEYFSNFTLPSDDSANDVNNATALGGTNTLAVLSDACSLDIEHDQVRALWYSVIGNGTYLEATTCGTETSFFFDSVLAVYEGSSCDNLTCIGVNYETDFCRHSAITWFAESEKVYYLQVYGQFGDAGFSEITVDLNPETPPPNGVCRDDDIPIAIDGTVVVGSTYLAPFADVCSALDNFSGNEIELSQSVFYNVIGNGTALRAYTCTEETRNFDTVLAVYAGSCGDLTCLYKNYDTRAICGTDGGSSISWFAEMGQVYHIQVSGSEYSTGTFGLAVEETNLPLDACLEQMPFSSTTRKCECVEDGDGVILSCADSCTYCNEYGNTLRETCAVEDNTAYYDEFGTITFRKQSFEFVSGRNETLLVEWSDCSAFETRTCTGCDVFIDETMCNSCDVGGPFDDDLFINCTNIEPDAVLDTTLSADVSIGDDIGNGVLQPLSFDNYNECLRDPVEVCESAQERFFSYSSSLYCTCVPYPYVEGHAIRDCAFPGDACTSCSADETVCARYTGSRDYLYDEYGDQVGEVMQIEYFRGLEGVLVVEEFFSGNSDCVVRFNGVECNSCSTATVTCPDPLDGNGTGTLSSGFNIDCSNIDPDAVIDVCDDDSTLFGTTENSFLQYITHISFEYCANLEASGELECQEEMEYEMGRQDVDCTCSETEEGTYKLYCKELSCLYCNADDTMCVIDTYGREYSSSGRFINVYNGYEFVLGPSHSVEFAINYYPDPRIKNYTCSAYVDGRMCEQCEICEYTGPFGYVNIGPVVTCNNLGYGTIDTCSDENSTSSSSNNDGDNDKNTSIGKESLSLQDNPFLPETDPAFDQCIIINGVLPQPTASPIEPQPTPTTISPVDTTPAPVAPVVVPTPTEAPATTPTTESSNGTKKSSSLTNSFIIFVTAITAMMGTFSFLSL